jgi:hypothetical protein
MRHRWSVVLLVGLTVVSCRVKRAGLSSDVREFGALNKITSEQASDVRLEGLKGVRYEAFRDVYQWAPAGYEAAHARVRFSDLTEAQFEGLRTRYGFGLSRVRYQPGATYELTDFLTPMMQAVVNHRFIQEMTTGYTWLSTNCWATGYEVLRTARADAEGFLVWSTTSASPIDRLLTSELQGQKLGEFDSVENLSRAKDLRFGDLVLQFDSLKNLDHVAVVVDRDLYFEKVAIVSNSPYRLVYGSDWYYDPAGGTLELWRYQAGTFPSPEVFFRSERRVDSDRLKTVERDLLRKDVRWFYDDAGRARLGPEAYKPMLLEKPEGY